jgi:hypothetical protein
VLDICVAFVAGAAANRSQMSDLKQKTASAPDRPGVAAKPART